MRGTETAEVLRASFRGTLEDKAPFEPPKFITPAGHVSKILRHQDRIIESSGRSYNGIDQMIPGADFSEPPPISRQTTACQDPLLLIGDEDAAAEAPPDIL